MVTSVLPSRSGKSTMQDFLISNFILLDSNIISLLSSRIKIPFIFISFIISDFKSSTEKIKKKYEVDFLNWLSQ